MGNWPPPPQCPSSSSRGGRGAYNDEQSTSEQAMSRSSTAAAAAGNAVTGEDSHIFQTTCPNTSIVQDTSTRTDYLGSSHCLREAFTKQGIPSEAMPTSNDFFVGG